MRNTSRGRLINNFLRKKDILVTLFLALTVFYYCFIFYVKATDREYFFNAHSINQLKSYFILLHDLIFYTYYQTPHDRLLSLQRPVLFSSPCVVMISKPALKTNMHYTLAERPDTFTSHIFSTSPVPFIQYLCKIKIIVSLTKTLLNLLSTVKQFSSLTELSLSGFSCS